MTLKEIIRKDMDIFKNNQLQKYNKITKLLNKIRFHYIFLEMPASFEAIKAFRQEKGYEALNAILYVNKGFISYKSLLNYSQQYMKIYRNKYIEIVELNMYLSNNEKKVYVKNWFNDIYNKDEKELDFLINKIEKILIKDYENDENIKNDINKKYLELNEKSGKYSIFLDMKANEKNISSLIDIMGTEAYKTFLDLYPEKTNLDIMSFVTCVVYRIKYYKKQKCLIENIQNINNIF